MLDDVWLDVAFAMDAIQTPAHPSGYGLTYRRYLVQLAYADKILCIWNKVRN